MFPMIDSIRWSGQELVTSCVASPGLGLGGAPGNLKGLTKEAPLQEILKVCGGCPDILG